MSKKHVSILSSFGGKLTPLMVIIAETMRIYSFIVFFKRTCLYFCCCQHIVSQKVIPERGRGSAGPNQWLLLPDHALDLVIELYRFDPVL